MKFNLKYIHYKLILEKQSPINRRELWLNMPALKWLKGYPKGNMNVLEFGCGGSTLYFSDNYNGVISIEDNKEWIKKIEKKLRKPNTVILEKFTEHFKTVKYDIILVDGTGDREEQFRIAKTLRKENGIIIFDNVDRYPKCLKEMNMVLTGYARGVAGITTTGIMKMKGLEKK